jgi:[pyruvate, water dikinase]-phosphate phosphotransferase / [pyruvate, water dikinase] kinase
VRRGFVPLAAVGAGSAILALSPRRRPLDDLAPRRHARGRLVVADSHAFVLPATLATVSPRGRGTLRAVANVKPPVELHVVSDSTGETATRLVHALEAQFPDQEFEEIRHPRVETVDDLRLAVERAKGRPAVVIYTLVEPELREQMRALCRRARLHYCDLLGHPIDAVARVSGHAAQMTPGARAPLDSTYFKRMAAIEFAVKFDDGMGSGLREADIVLVGVSRTSKTPLSMYLGYLGYKTANVPIVKGIEPPAALFEIDPLKIVGLTIEAGRLAEIREQRARRLGGNNRRYTQLVAIYDELEAAEAVHRRLGCPVIEISELSIEETAARVIRLIEQRRAGAAATTA